MTVLLPSFRRPLRLPSTDLFFRNACGDRVVSKWRNGPIVARGANCFVHGEAMALIRSDTPEIMLAALDWPGRLAYVVDDDIAGAAESPGLPDPYRQRLAEFDRHFHQRLIARADLLLAASDVLAERLAGRGLVRRIDPCWSLPLADQRHFAEIAQGGPLRIAHLGSGSHLGGLVAMAEAITELLDRDPTLDFTYVAPQAVTPTLESHPRGHRLAPRNWPRYRRWLRSARFHLALYPLTASRFDSARSCNKLIEHAIVGAVGVYPEDWAAAGLVADGAFAAPADPAHWAHALGVATARRAELPGMAKRAAAALSRHDTRSMQRSLWSEFFQLEI